ncbi:MAG: cryptochrome/photolyase family protein [Oscillochloridaceae bacterium umkhey_bin13]
MALLIHWFRRDLRLTDNVALTAAAQAAGGAVLPVFVLDPALLHGRMVGPPRLAWLFANLHALDTELRTLGSRLILRHGPPLPSLLTLAREVDAAGVYWNRDYSPYAIQRDRALKTALREAGLVAQSHKDAVIFELGEVAKADGRPYTVYTAYARRWRARLAEQGCTPKPPPALVSLPSWPASEPLPSMATASGDLAAMHLPVAGSQAAQTRLQSFLDPLQAQNLATYATQRDLLAAPGTSRLSPYLRMGSLSIRVALRAALDHLAEPELPSAARESAERWIGELAWRDFYTQILYHFPHVTRGAFRREYDALPWEDNPTYLAAWQAGLTGYPVVDAAMRQLRQEGWMHNRARMIVASFLSKDLLLDWRLGEQHFMHWLIDGDPAANNGGWQWAAGTGTDAQPYFRIFNPVSQGQKFDPDGTYVRRYLPELTQVPTRFIHTPHLLAPADQIRADVQIGRDYPAPIVEHKLQRERALALYATVRQKR